MTKDTPGLSAADSEKKFLEEMSRELAGWRDPAARLRHVKVDGSIVRALLRSEVARQKMKAVVRVGDTIGVEVIAECVEEPDILEELRALRVGYAQGFGIARPAPIDRSAAPPMP